MKDAALCAPAVHCYSDWTAWGTNQFVPLPASIESPDPVDDTADDQIAELRTATKEVLDETLDPVGVDVDSGQVMQFIVLLVALVVASASVIMSFRRGLAPLGIGMGCAIFVLILFTGSRLLGTPLAWAVAAQVLIAVTGLFALIRQLGVLR